MRILSGNHRFLCEKIKMKLLVNFCVCLYGGVVVWVDGGFSPGRCEIVLYIRSQQFIFVVQALQFVNSVLLS